MSLNRLIFVVWHKGGGSGWVVVVSICVVVGFRCGFVRLREWMGDFWREVVHGLLALAISKMETLT